MTNKEPDEITFHFMKSSGYRTVHVDGAFGGLTPKADLAVAFFSERFALPQRTTHAVNGHALGPEICREGKKGLIREIEFNCVMDIPTTMKLIDFLQGKVDEYNTLKGIEQNDV